MRIVLPILFLLSPLFVLAEDGEAETALEAFTGQVTRPKVRLRAKPSLDGAVVRELQTGDLFVVDGEQSDFYAVRVPADLKTYIYRGLVIDGIVEGQHVNVRLEPTTEAPIVCQLNTGDRVEGRIANTNTKWLEIEAPASCRFFIAKEYIDHVGGPEYLARVQLRQKEVEDALRSAYTVGKEELDKPFEEANSERIKEAFTRVIEEFVEFPEHVAEAKEGLALAIDSYLQKKIQFLEEKAEGVSAGNYDLDQEVQAFQERLAKLEEELKYDLAEASDIGTEKPVWTSSSRTTSTSWEPREAKYYESWREAHGDANLEDFYHEERVKAVTLTGVIEPYTSSVKNKPGNYILRDRQSQLPIAYLYSTKINLEGGIGQVATIKASPRPNNNFAFPAYHVISIE